MAAPDRGGPACQLVGMGLTGVGRTGRRQTQQAIAMLPNPEVANGTILNVVQKGYVLHKRVLRPARVVVTKN